MRKNPPPHACPLQRSPSTTWLSLVLLLPAVASGQSTPETLDHVQVSGHRIPLTQFPGAVTVINGDTLRDGQRQLSLAESLQGVPGVIAMERYNYAQDLQLQSRGFGARSTFGVRGLSLVTDGIPASALDGQGQASGFALSMLDRIEVLRGPLALQYGNAAGGAIVGESVLDDDNRLQTQGWLGSDASRRFLLRGDAATGNWRGRAGISHFATDGHRPHSAARRDEAHGIVQWTPSAQHRLQLVVDALEQPDTDDPLGLTPAQWRLTPEGTDPVALAYNTRKNIEQRQAGLHWDWDYAPGRELSLALWHTRREVGQFLAIPVAVQRPPSHAGGVIDLARRSSGLSLSHRTSGARGAWAAGIDIGTLDEARRGYENFIGTELGVRGRLRRDESNRVRNHEVWLSGETRWGENWSGLAAARHGRLDFTSRDHYIAPGNGDDSGRLDYSETAFSAGIARRFKGGEVFASLGRGFETPTITELAYRPDGKGGLNTSLGPAHFASGEIGARWRGPGYQASVAVYRIDGRDEITQVMSSGGRSSYANAARTRRDGLEASLGGDLHPNISYAFSANLIDARFRQGWEAVSVRNGVAETRVIPAGHRIPGIPRVQGFARIDLHREDRTLALALETTCNAAIPVDDANSASAPGSVRHALALRWQHPQAPGWHAFARIDNLLDRRYVGSVIVNEANGRSFEPAPGRSFTIGLGWQTGE